jgi:hypothetical protein
VKRAHCTLLEAQSYQSRQHLGSASSRLPDRGKQRGQQRFRKIESMRTDKSWELKLEEALQDGGIFNSVFYEFLNLLKYFNLSKFKKKMSGKFELL